MEGNRYRALLPAQQHARESLSKKKRRLTRVACNHCRTRKLGCDGNRPCMPCRTNNVECVYISKDSAETPQMVLRREIDALRAERHDLRELVDYLSNGPEELVQEALRRLRTSEDMNDILDAVKEGSLDSNGWPEQSSEEAEQAANGLLPTSLDGSALDFTETSHAHSGDTILDAMMDPSSNFSMTQSWLDGASAGGPSNYSQGPQQVASSAYELDRVGQRSVAYTSSPDAPWLPDGIANAVSGQSDFVELQYPGPMAYLPQQSSQRREPRRPN